MYLTIDQVVKYLGQKVHDPYGREIGTVVSIYSEVDGTVTAIEITGNTSSETIPVSRVEITHEGLVVMPAWKADAIILEKKLDRARKRARALEELYRKGQIPGHAYEDVKKRLDKELQFLKEQSRRVKDELKTKMNELENQIIHIEKAMTHLIISYTAGEIPESNFKQSADILRLIKSKALDEKRDVEKHLELIEKLETEPLEPVRSIMERVQGAATESLIPSSSGPIEVKVINS